MNQEAIAKFKGGITARYREAIRLAVEQGVATAEQMQELEKDYHLRDMYLALTLQSPKNYTEMRAACEMTVMVV